MTSLTSDYFKEMTSLFRFDDTATVTYQEIFNAGGNWLICRKTWG
ncbi:hypothetical protein CAter282_2642 [Collimonas arenae]|uniref:Uncharacterized protein n=1 Tax=Collimonas arenae TaxID=279058 RepID=A0A127QK38_9BURK|nr:hypothetical protein CAter282_2642 [Collimonas arenae]